MRKEVSRDIIEFLEDHPMAQSVVESMMKKSALLNDDPKQVAKLCKNKIDNYTLCNGFFKGEHHKLCPKYKEDK